jgi:uncharacterized protein (DUF1919 family)
MTKNFEEGKADFLDEIMASFKRGISDRIIAPFQRARLRNMSFSIISNDCVGAGIYQKLGLQYTTPTIGLFFFSDDYIRFLENFEHYIRQQVIFIESSKHPEANELCRRNHYPIGVLDSDVEVQFLHYESEEEAVEKWNRRKERIYFENLFFIYSDKDNFKEEYLDRYEKLPFKNKIFFSSKPRGQIGNLVFVRDYEGKAQVGDSSRNRKYEKYINIISWLNGDKDFLKH